MKELGTRYENLTTVRIVELSDTEFDTLKNFIETQGIDPEENTRREWFAKQASKARNLSLDGRCHNLVNCSLWNTLFYPKPLITFEEWAKSALENYEIHREIGRFYYPFENVRNLGIKSYIKIIEMLKEKKK